MSFITLTRGLFAEVDDSFYTWASQWKWYAHKSGGNRFYAARQGSRKGGTKTKVIFLHRELVKLAGFLNSALEVDHKNGDSLNNRLDNLRIASHSQNLANQIRTANKASKYRGVYRVKNRWTAQISIAGKRKHLGYFSCEKEAAHAYDEAAKHRFGDFARVNFRKSLLSKSENR